MKKGWVLLIEFDLPLEIISGVIVGVDLIHPERSLVEGIKPQTEADEQAENKDKNFFSFRVTHKNSTQNKKVLGEG